MKTFFFQLLFIFFVIFIVSSCARIYHKSKFHLATSPFKLDSISFRIDGYYFHEKYYENGEMIDSTKSCGIKPIIFYGDGYVRKSGFIHGLKPYKDEKSKNDSLKKSMKELDLSIINNDFHVNIKNTIWDWGMYSQRGINIKIQCFSNHFGDYRLIDYNGIVKNDSVIILTKKFGYKFNSPPYIINDEINEIYRFKKFHIKPDSANYIKSNIEKFK